uniref:TNFR-Cys domain-containing protein n=1 Tax=Denticeps clupeoides TaxID=299321 RepID=A0AAY4CA67_9TELE
MSLWCAYLHTLNAQTWYKMLSLFQSFPNDSDTVCEPCPVAETAEAYNYADKCISCRKCKKDKGLVPAQECNRSVNARCKCQDDMYCMRTEQSGHILLCHRVLCCVYKSLHFHFTRNIDL